MTRAFEFAKARMKASHRALRALERSNPSSIVRDRRSGSAFRQAAERQKPWPKIGARIGALIVKGYVLGRQRVIRALILQCDCRRPEFIRTDSSVKVDRRNCCAVCAEKYLGRKAWWSYAGILPQTDHRIRLMGRIRAAIRRCHSPNDPSYRNYGGRGIAVYGPWRRDPRLFLAYLKDLPGWDNPALELDRIDNDGDYEPGNIRFVSKRANIKNRRSVPDLRTEILRLQAEISYLQVQNKSMYGD